MRRAITKTKLIALVVSFSILSILTPSIPASAAAPSFSDIGGHWAQEAILRWSEIGVLSGYPDGTFRPNNTVTRGELATIINNLMHFPEAPDELKIFSDLEGKWYDSTINALALQGAYLVTHGEAKGGAPLTREEAAAMIFNAFPVLWVRYPNRFVDSDSMNADYVDKINVMYNAGFLSGFPDGSFKPNDPITRAQVVTILNNMIDEFITEPGVYEGLEGKRVLVTAPGVEITGTRGVEYLVISPEAGMGKTVYIGARFATQWLYDLDSESHKTASGGTISRFIQSYDARFADGAGLADFPYFISNQSQLQLLSEYLDNRHQYIHFALANDISLAGNWTPIGYFDSTSTELTAHFQSNFDGNGFSINGLSITSDVQNGEATGLFASMNNRASIRNLTVSGNISFSTTAEIRSVGGICGVLLGGNIDNCVSHVNISVKSPNDVEAGGIAGLMNRGKISNCRADGDINASVKDSVGSNYAAAGGVAGAATSSGSVTACVSHANVSAEAYSNAFAGGVVGSLSNNVSLTGCQADGTIAASSATSDRYAAYAGGIVGRISFSRSVQGCLSNANVFASAFNTAYAGGIAGLIRGSPGGTESILNSCIAYGEIKAVSAGSVESTGTCAGGIAGYVTCTQISDCNSSANIAASGGFHSQAGGLIGLVGGDDDANSCDIRRCYSSGRVHAENGG